ncbi:hypothetical protein NDU88_008768 [Pleurodeles waltl]|uniref:Uncharacterized protein n=1 Tax=Pleurodeles waltl TaxID=8319 RepID=A0AAV7NX28_PLEWA|nr:hypothetical protein NDU88_008768 [Pleurodeles waltl]
MRTKNLIGKKSPPMTACDLLNKTCAYAHLLPPPSKGEPYPEPASSATLRTSNGAFHTMIQVLPRRPFLRNVDLRAPAKAKSEAGNHPVSITICARNQVDTVNLKRNAMLQRCTRRFQPPRKPRDQAALRGCLSSPPAGTRWLKPAQRTLPRCSPAN